MKHFFGIVLFFALTGPLSGLVGVGVLQLWSGLDFTSGVSIFGLFDGLFKLLDALPVWLFFFLPAAYFFGGIQSLFVGIISAIWHSRYNMLPIAIPALAAVLISLPLGIWASYYHWVGINYEFGPLASWCLLNVFAASISWRGVKKYVLATPTI